MNDILKKLEEFEQKSRELQERQRQLDIQRSWPFSPETMQLMEYRLGWGWKRQQLRMAKRSRNAHVVRWTSTLILIAIIAIAYLVL